MITVSLSLSGLIQPNTFCWFQLKFIPFFHLIIQEKFLTQIAYQSQCFSMTFFVSLDYYINDSNIPELVISQFFAKGNSYRLVFETKITSRCNTENFYWCFWKCFIMSPLCCLQFDKEIVHIYCYRCCNETTLPVLFFSHLSVASTWFTASVPDLLHSPEIQCFSILLILPGVSFLLKPSSSVAYLNFVFFLFSRWPSHFIPVQKIIILMKDIVKINSFYMITHRSSHWEVLCWIDTPLTNNRKSPDYNFSKVFEKYLRCDFFWEKLHSFSELLCGYFPSIFLNFPESLFEEQPLVAPSIFKTNNHCIMPIIFLMESKSQKRPTLSEKVRYVLENGSY